MIEDFVIKYLWLVVGYGFMFILIFFFVVIMVFGFMNYRVNYEIVECMEGKLNFNGNNVLVLIKERLCV